MKKFVVSEGEVYVFIEQEEMYIKAVTSYGDPVELRKEDAVKLAEALLEMARQIDD